MEDSALMSVTHAVVEETPIADDTEGTDDASGESDADVETSTDQSSDDTSEGAES